MGSIDRVYQPTASIVEKRRRYRFNMGVDVSIWPKSGTSHVVHLVDMSVDGAAIEPAKPLEMKSTGVLVIESGQGPLRLPYSVVRVANVNGLKRTGLAFFLMESVRLQLAAVIDGMTGGG